MLKSKFRTLHVALIGAALLNVSVMSFGWCSPPTAANFPDEVTFNYVPFPGSKNNEEGLWFPDLGTGAMKIRYMGHVNQDMVGYNPEKPHHNPFAPSGASFPAKKVPGEHPKEVKGWSGVWELPYTAGEFKKGRIMIEMSLPEK